MKTQFHYVTGIAPLSGTPKADGVNILEELIADEGMKLTQNAYIPVQDRIIATAVMLGKGCSADDWMEITQQEADQILKEQEDFAKEQEAKMNEELQAPR